MIFKLSATATQKMLEVFKRIFQCCLPTTESTNADYILDKVYENLQDPYTYKFNDPVFKNATTSPAYGELSRESVRDLIKIVQLGPDDIFCDLGCGLGKVVMQVALESKAKQVIGIELSSERVKAATKVMHKLQKAGYISEGRTKIVEANILDVENYADATVLYSACTCFSHLMPSVTKKVFEQCKNLKWMILDLYYCKDYDLHQIKKRFDVVQSLSLKASWSNCHWVLLAKSKQGTSASSRRLVDKALII